jgi:uncharacterized protein YbjQ (UPF0145 family)
MERVLTALCVFVALAGCYMPHPAPLYEGSIITHRALVDRPFEELGLVHAETWGPTLYWRTSAADLRDTVNKALVAEAEKQGADAIVDVEVRVENHYSFVLSLFIFGWEECHATGTAIRYTK